MLKTLSYDLFCKGIVHLIASHMYRHHCRRARKRSPFVLTHHIPHYRFAANFFLFMHTLLFLSMPMVRRFTFSLSLSFPFFSLVVALYAYLVHVIPLPSCLAICYLFYLSSETPMVIPFNLFSHDLPEYGSTIVKNKVHKFSKLIHTSGPNHLSTDWVKHDGIKKSTAVFKPAVLSSESRRSFLTD